MDQHLWKVEGHGLKGQMGSACLRFSTSCVLLNNVNQQSKSFFDAPEIGKCWSPSDLLDFGGVGSCDFWKLPGVSCHMSNLQISLRNCPCGCNWLYFQTWSCLETSLFKVAREGHLKPASRSGQALVHSPSVSPDLLPGHQALVAGVARGLWVGVSQPVNRPLGPGCCKSLGSRKARGCGVLPSSDCFKPFHLAFPCLEKNVSILTWVLGVSSDKWVTVLVAHCSPYSPAQGWD